MVRHLFSFLIQYIILLTSDRKFRPRHLKYPVGRKVMAGLKSDEEMKSLKGDEVATLDASMDSGKAGNDGGKKNKKKGNKKKKGWD